MSIRLGVRLYKNYLPIMTFVPTLMGFYSGLYTGLHESDKSLFSVYSNWLGFTGVGLLTGLTYPVSIPLITGYFLYKNIKKINQ